MNNKVKISTEQIQEETQRFIVKVYGWMALALVITGIISYWTSLNPDIVKYLVKSEYVFIGLLILEIILVAYLVKWIMKMSSQTATLIFILYSMLNGLTLSVVFLVYTTDSIVSTFLITAGMFAVMSLYGYFTKSDLTSWGNILFMGLLGLIAASFMNFFYQNNTFSLITNIAGVIIFTGLIAYDTQKIKNINIIGNEGTDEDKKEAIIGALSLYLDFINLFLRLLRLLGRRK